MWAVLEIIACSAMKLPQMAIAAFILVALNAQQRRRNKEKSHDT
jgi:hypothetical protein